MYSIQNFDFTLWPAPPTRIISVGFMESIQALIVGEECERVVVTTKPFAGGTRTLIPRTPRPTIPGDTEGVYKRYLFYS